MARYYITHQDVSLDCGYITVNMRSHLTAHLWLLYTTTTPLSHDVQDAMQPGPRPHHRNLELFIEGVVEQEEPGNTNVHTFHFPWPAQRSILWFYTINQGTGKTKASRSPVFAYEFFSTPIWREDWDPQSWPSHGWTLGDFPPYSIAHPSLNNLLLRKSNIGIGSVQSSFAQLGNGFGPVIGPYDSCGLNIAFTMPPDDTTPPFGPNSLNILLRPYNRPGDQLLIILVPNSATSVPPDAPPPINRMVIKVPTGSNALALNQIMTVRHGAYPTSPTPGPITVDQLTFASNGHDNTAFYLHDSYFGTLTFQQVSGTPKDVSKFWRSLRLSPKLP